MSILVNGKTRVICQGITGSAGGVSHEGMPFGIRHENGWRRDAASKGERRMPTDFRCSIRFGRRWMRRVLMRR